MLSDEEKKAIEYWKKYMEILHWNTQLASEHHMSVLLNLIEKQSKEIEELKEKNRQGKMRIVQLENEITARIEDVNKYFTPNDKIKAKIEELEKQDRENRMSHNYLVIHVLQSLLEKE